MENADPRARLEPGYSVSKHESKRHAARDGKKTRTAARAAVRVMNS